VPKTEVNAWEFGTDTEGAGGGLAGPWVATNLSILEDRVSGDILRISSMADRFFLRAYATERNFDRSVNDKPSRSFVREFNQLYESSSDSSSDPSSDSSPNRSDDSRTRKV